MITYISILFGICIFCCIILLLYPQGKQADTVKRRLNNINSSQKGYLHDDELSYPFLERIIKLYIKPFMFKIRKAFINHPSRGIFLKGFHGNKLKKNIYKAGINMEVHEYQLFRIVILLGSALLVLAAAYLFKQRPLYLLLAPFIGIYIGYAVLRFHLSSKISKRQKLMERQLPEVLDLLSINVEAGLGFEQAMLHITEHLEGPLVDELVITYREMSMGRSKREALLAFAERCDIAEIKSFVGTIVQANELGISIKNVLRSQASTMRQNRRSKIEEKAHKISIKILLPMVLFIFPVIFIILMGPAVVKVINQFG